jgi:RNA polymerase sigma-70 factor (ECF subfamily)
MNLDIGTIDEQGEKEERNKTAIMLDLQRESWRTLSLEQMMLAYQSGDNEAGGYLFQSLRVLLLRFFLKQRLTRYEAEDLLQETWLRVHRCRHAFRPEAQLLPWLFCIARRVRVDAFRRRYRIESVELCRGTSETAQSFCSITLQRHVGTSFDILIEQLPLSQQRVLVLLKVNGFTLEEVAAITCSSVGAVKQKTTRAYSKLRKHLVLDHDCAVR